VVLNAVLREARRTALRSLKASELISRLRRKLDMADHAS
jgi:hypothetical protein